MQQNQTQHKLHTTIAKDWLPSIPNTYHLTLDKDQSNSPISIHLSPAANRNELINAIIAFSRHILFDQRL